MALSLHIKEQRTSPQGESNSTNNLSFLSNREIVFFEGFALKSTRSQLNNKLFAWIEVHAMENIARHQMLDANLMLLKAFLNSEQFFMCFGANGIL
jgi:hypothetical protein